MVGFDALKSEVVARLGNRTDINSRVERWINHAFFELLLNPRFSFFELDTLTTFSTVAAQASYDLTVIAPTLWIILSLRDNTNERHLARSHHQVIDRMTTTPGQPARYYRFAQTVVFDPVPDNVFQMQLRYRIRPGDQASGSNFAGLGTEWEEPLVVLSTVKGFEALDQRDKATQQRQLLEAIMPTRQDVPTLEDADAEVTIAPRMEAYG